MLRALKFVYLTQLDKAPPREFFAVPSLRAFFNLTRDHREIFRRVSMHLLYSGHEVLLTLLS
jgi:hypothetical protein